ncbi:MAG TPA: hypothetical protein VGJ84_09905 [Polyangiaceae bacterium]
MRLKTLGFIILTTVLGGAACSGSEPAKRGSPGGSANGGLGGTGAIGVDGGGTGATGGNFNLGVGGTTTNGALTIVGPSTIDVDGTAKTVMLTAQYSDGQKPSVVVWSVDDVRIGSISADGVFTANGLVGGVVTVTAQAASDGGSLKITVNVNLQRNSGNVSAGDTTKLKAGGSADSAFAFLYPFDKTVFPRGLQPPLLQFAGAAADSTYLKISAPNFLYEGFDGPSSPTRITIPDDVWKGVTYTAGPTDSVNVSVTKMSAGAVSGPVQENWRIAQGKLKGIIYYNTYNSASTTGCPISPSNPGGNCGAVMKVKLGSPYQMLLTNNTCGVVCHSVSANGKVLATGRGLDFNTIESAIYDLDTAGNATVRPAGAVGGSLWTFPALSPDGTIGVTNSSHNMPSQLYYDTVAFRVADTASYQGVSSSSFGMLYPHMPVFAPDGTKLAVVNGDKGNKGSSQILSVYDTDLSQPAAPVFSNLRDVAQTTQTWIAWPTFLPDANAIIYHEGPSWATDKPNNGLGGNLRLVDIQNGNASKKLDALNGYTDTGTFYLPYGVAADGDVDFEPTAMSVARGGYYWVMFTSRRSYGNMIYSGGDCTPWSVDPARDCGADRYAGSTARKKIWVSAIDIDYASKADPSHPAFYLEGQELASGNMRPFAALEPCLPQGAPCETGSDCCDGYCRQTTSSNNQPVLVCIAPPMVNCSNLDEPCATAGDCCDVNQLCINHRCAVPTPPQ